MAGSSNSDMPIGDDEIFRRKLLTDGEGMGDDRRLNILLRSFFKWCDAKDESEEEMTAGYNRLLNSLDHTEFLMAKSQQSQAVNIKEIKNYQEMYSQIEAKIAGAQTDILDMKSELQKSKRIRKNKQKYDALARNIAEQPDRKETLAKLQQLGEEINELASTQRELEKEKEKKEKNFSVLFNAAQQLCDIESDEAMEMKE